jgi:dolichol-phosphate mannosyltransferase
MIKPKELLKMLPSHWQVPSADVYELRQECSRYCVCIPVINEDERIIKQLARMADLGLETDIIIADGGSTDGSMNIEHMDALSVHTLLIKTGPGRLSAQLRMGLSYALHKGYEGIVIVDGNGKDGVEAIPRFTSAMDDGYDHVQGSRYIPGGQAINTPSDRHYGVKLVHAPIISLAAGFRYTDTTNGFRAYSRRFLCDDRVEPFRDVFQDYNLHYYLAIRAARLGYRVIEVPVTRIYPTTGPVPSKISGWGGRIRIFSQLIYSAFGAYNP